MDYKAFLLLLLGLDANASDADILAKLLNNSLTAHSAASISAADPAAEVARQMGNSRESLAKYGEKRR